MLKKKLRLLEITVVDEMFARLISVFDVHFARLLIKITTAKSISTTSISI